MAKAIQEKRRSTFRSLLRKKISRWNKPREKQILPTNINAKEKRVIKIFLQYYQPLWNKFYLEGDCVSPGHPSKDEGEVIKYQPAARS